MGGDILSSDDPFFYLDEGQPAQALKLFEERIVAAQSPEERCQELANSCYALVALGRFDEARQRLLGIFNSTEESLYLHQIAYVERERKNYREALDFIEEEKKLLDVEFSKASINPSMRALRLATNLYEQALLHEELGHTAQSRQHLLKARDFAFLPEQEDPICKACVLRLEADFLAKEKNKAAEEAIRIQFLYHWAAFLFKSVLDDVGAQECEEKVFESPILHDQVSYFFRAIDFEDDQDFERAFRQIGDSFEASFGSRERFIKEAGPEGSIYKDRCVAKKKLYPATHMFLVESQGHVVGQVEMGRYKHDLSKGYANIYYLEEKYRGLGLAEILDQWFEKAFREQGLSDALLSVSPSNTRALKFYIKRGWKNLGPRPDAPEVNLMERSFA
jgi:ribosomal protein S18 acetylase RimI-like enzyme